MEIDRKGLIMVSEREIEDRIREMIVMGGGQRDFTGDVMDEILYSTGCSQKELESVMEGRFMAVEVGRYGIPNIWAVRPE